MEEIEIPMTSLFVRHWYVLHADSEWCGEQCIQYKSHLISENRDLRDALAFPWREKHCFRLKNGRSIIRKGSDPARG